MNRAQGVRAGERADGRGPAPVMTLEQVAARLGMSPSNVQRLEQRALCKMRHECERQGLRFEHFLGDRRCDEGCVGGGSGGAWRGGRW